MASSLFWIDTVAYCSTTLVAISLLLAVLGAGGRRLLNISFALLMGGVSLWAGTSAILRFALWLETGTQQFWMEVSALASALIGPLLLVFATIYTSTKYRWPYGVAIGVVLVIGLLCVPLFRHQIITNVRLGASGMVTRNRGPLDAVLLAPLFAGAVPVLVLLWRGRRRLREAHLPISIAILVISGLLFGFLELPYPTLSIAMVVTISMMGYAVLVRQHFNPLREVTERLEELQALHATIVHSLEGGILLEDETGRIAFVNPKLAELLGYAAEELIGRDWRMTVGPGHVVEVEKGSSKRSRSITGRYETVLQAKNGRRVPVIVSSRPLLEGERFAGVLSVVTDITEHRRVEQALRESEETYRTLVRTSPDAVTATDLGGRITYVSERTLKMHGSETSEELLGRSALELIAPEDHEKAEANLQRALEEGSTGGVEYTLLRKDGSRFTGEVNAALITDADGKPKGFISTTRDVTERKQAEEALKESEEKFRTLAEQSPNMIFINKRGKVVYANKKCGEVMGYTRDEFYTPDFDFFTLIAPGLRESVKASFSRHLEHEEVEPYEYALVTKDGRRVEAILTTTLIDYEGERAILGTVTDITEHRQLERQVEERRLYLESVLACAPDAIVTLDAHDNVLEWNQGAERLFGYSKEEALGRNADDLVTGSDAKVSEKATAFTRRVLDGESIAPTETVRYRKDGTPVHVIVAGAPIVVQDELAGVVAIYTDITELKQAEEALQQRYRELELLNRSARALISTLDLDQVLSTILEEVRHLMGVVACSVWLVSPETGGLVCRQATGPEAEFVRGWRLAPGEGVAGWVARSGESLIVPDVGSNGDHSEAVDRRIGLSVRSLLGVPLRVKDEVIGVLQVVDSEIGRFNMQDLALLEPLVATAAMALENARLYEQARQDAEAKSTLLREVNHRVKNNISAIIGLLYAMRRRSGMEDQPAYQFIVRDLINRLRGLVTVNRLLAASEWTPLPLSEVAAQIIASCLQTLAPDSWVTVDVTPSPIRVTPDQAHDLTLVINELTTNAVKHGLQEGRKPSIAVRIGQDADTILLKFRDNGPGYPQEALGTDGSSLGLDLVRNIVSKNLQGKFSLHNDKGAVAVIRFKAKAEASQGEYG